MTDPLLSIKELEVRFKTEGNDVTAVNKVSLSIQQGQTYGLVGESGSGKSTITLALLGLLAGNGRIEGGQILFDGADLLLMKEKHKREIRGNRIATIFQDPMTSLNPYLRIGNQVAEPLRQHQGLSRTAARTKTIQLLKDVGIPECEKRVDRYPHEFSGGQRQRIMIAMALACDPDLLIADEPTTALDVTVQAQVLGLLKNLQARRNLSILLITHDMGVVAGVCDHVGVMRHGLLVEENSTDQLFADPQHPYTRMLLASVPRLHGERPQRLASEGSAS